MATKAEIEALIVKIDAKIEDAIDNPKPSYTIGDVKFDWKGYYDWLLKQREYYRKVLKEDFDEIVCVTTVAELTTR